MPSEFRPSAVRHAVSSVVVALALALVAPAFAAVPSGFIERQIVGSLGAPTAMTFAPDGRLFVCTQGGALRVIKNGRLLSTPFVQLTVDSNGERGLLGVAFDPDFATTPYVYVYYTVPSPAHNRISRLTAQGDVAVPGSEVVLLELNALSGATNHNGGAIHFGPVDGKLYAGVGENANGPNAQTLTNLLGKVLRINKDGSIPTDNPFFNTATGNNRAIWAYGLRNPFTFAFNAAGSRMFVNDVGQSTWEEVNLGVAGANYGWPTTEGVTANPAFRSPLLAYGHGTGASTGCAIVGGAFYEPSRGTFPAEFQDDYFFADLCSGWIRRYDAVLATNTAFATGIGTPVDLATGPEGDLYYLARGSGGILGRISTDRIFGNGFEGGNLSAWSGAAGGNLAVTGAAALAGTGQGLEVGAGDTAAAYVRDSTPNDENRYRARFYLDPNGFDPGEMSGHLRVRIFMALEENPQRRLVTLVLRRKAGAYSLMARVRRDDGTRADTAFVGLSDEPHLVEIDWRRSSAPGMNNGAFTLRIDDATVATLASLDNDVSAVDLVRLGLMSVKPGATGTLHFDEFESRRETAIGPLVQ